MKSNEAIRHSSDFVHRDSRVQNTCVPIRIYRLIDRYSFKNSPVGFTLTLIFVCGDSTPQSTSSYRSCNGRKQNIIVNTTKNAAHSAVARRQSVVILYYRDRSEALYLYPVSRGRQQTHFVQSHCHVGRRAVGPAVDERERVGEVVLVYRRHRPGPYFDAFVLQ